MTKILAAAFVAAVICTSAFANAATLPSQNDKSSNPPSVTGRWTMNVQGGAHGTTTMGLTLRQDGAKVTGTFASPHGEMPIEGSLVDGKLSLATTGSQESAITFTATLKEDGSLAGYLSSSMGDMTWTAERVKDKK